MTPKLIKFGFSILFFWLLVLVGVGVGQQTVGGGSSGGTGLTITTVAGLASVAGKTNGTIATVTDGTSSSDCTVGGAGFLVNCQYNGSTWSQMGASGSGGTTFPSVTGGTNANALVMGTGGSLTTSGTGTITANNATAVAASVFNLGAITTGTFKIPSSAGATATATKNLVIDSTTGLIHGYTNAADSIWPQTLANASHKWLNSFTSTTGVFTQTQPASTDLSDYGSFPGAAFGSQTAKQFFAAPNGSAGNPSFRAIVASDLPAALSSSTSVNGTTIPASVTWPVTIANVAHKWLNSFTQSTGAFTQTQPASTDLSDYGSVSPSGLFGATPIPIASGGSGQTTKQAAFDALSPGSSEGDLIYFHSSHNVNLGVGTNAQCLTSNGTDPIWGSCATGSIGGTGTTNILPKFTATATIGNSAITDNGTVVNTTEPLQLTQAVAPTGSSGSSWLWADSTALRLQMKNATNTAVNVVASGVDINTSDQVTATHLASPLPTAQGGTAQNSTATFPTSGTVAVAGSCANQAVTATTGSGVTCNTLTSAYVDNSIALTGTDINTSNQVTATHLVSPLPSSQGGTANAFFTVSGPATSVKTFTFPNASATVLTSNAAVTIAQGGTGTGSTLTGLVRGSASAMTAAELSGDATTSGSNAVTVVKVNGVSYGTSPGTNTVAVVTGTNAVTYEAVPNAALANSSGTINGQTCTLGSTCNVNVGATSGTVAVNNGNGSALNRWSNKCRHSDLSHSSHRDCSHYQRESGGSRFRVEW